MSVYKFMTVMASMSNHEGKRLNIAFPKAYSKQTYHPEFAILRHAQDDMISRRAQHDNQGCIKDSIMESDQSYIFYNFFKKFSLYFAVKNINLITGVQNNIQAGI
jgi:hypothetical protein